MTLQRDVTFNLSAGEVRQPEVSRTPESVASLVNLGVGLFKEHKAKQAEQARIARQESISSEGQRLIDQYLNAIEQNPQQANRAAIQFRQAVGSLPVPDVTEQEKQFIRKQFKEAVGKTAGAVVQEHAGSRVKDIDSQVNMFMKDETDRATLFEMAPELVDRVTTGQASFQEKQKLVMIGNRLEAQQLKASAAREEALGLAKENAFAATTKMNESLQERNKILSQSINGLVFQADLIARDPSADAVAAFESQRQQLVNVLDMSKREAVNDWEALANNAQDEESRKLIRAEKDNYIKNIDLMMANLSGLDKDQFQSTTKAMKFLQDKLGLEAMQSAPILFQMKETYGAGFNAVMTTALQGDSAMLQQLREKIQSGIRQSFTAQESMVLHLDNLSRLHSDKSLLDFGPEQKEEMASSLYAVAKEEIESGLSADLPQATKENLGRNISIILDMAVETGDVNQQNQALNLLNHPNYAKFVDSLDEDTKKTLNQMTTQFNVDVLSDRNDGLIQKIATRPGVQFDVSQGKFVLDESAFEVKIPKRVSQARAGETSLGKGIDAARSEVQRANELMDKVVKSKANDGFLATLPDSDVKQWLVFSSEASIPVKGTLRDFDKDFREAAKQRRPVEEIKQQQEQQIQSQSALEQTQARIDELEAALAVSAIQPETEEQRLINALAKAKSREEREAILDELDKL